MYPYYHLNKKLTKVIRKDKTEVMQKKMEHVIQIRVRERIKSHVIR